VTRYLWVAARRAEGFPTVVSCRVVGVGRQAFYDWSSQRPAPLHRFQLCIKPILNVSESAECLIVALSPQRLPALQSVREPSPRPWERENQRNRRYRHRDVLTDFPQSEQQRDSYVQAGPRQSPRQPARRPRQPDPVGPEPEGELADRDEHHELGTQHIDDRSARHPQKRQGQAAQGGDEKPALPPVAQASGTTYSSRRSMWKLFRRTSL